MRTTGNLVVDDHSQPCTWKLFQLRSTSRLLWTVGSVSAELAQALGADPSRKIPKTKRRPCLGFVVHGFVRV